MLSALAAHARRVTATPPWGRTVAAGRTLLALSAALTLAFNPDSSMFPLEHGTLTTQTCRGAASWGLFCVAGPLWARILALIVLLAVISGYTPRWTALPHWYVSQSLAVSIYTVEGGDHLASVLTLLLVPVLLTDPRRNHWCRITPTSSGTSSAYVARSALFVVRVQMAVVYLHASLGKLSSTEWADGTALYYWLSDPVFGASAWAAPVLTPVLATSFGTAVLTWGTLVIEFALALGLIAGPTRPVLLVLGLVLHGSIALVMGLVTFTLVMAAGLVLYLYRSEDWAGLRGWVSRNTPRSAPPATSGGSREQI